MAREILDKITEAERKSKKTVADAEENSKRAIAEAEEQIIIERKSFYDKLKQKKSEKIDEINKQLHLIAEENENEIKRQIMITADRYKTMENAAAEKVLEIVLE